MKNKLKRCTIMMKSTLMFAKWGHFYLIASFTFSSQLHSTLHCWFRHFPKSLQAQHVDPQKTDANIFSLMQQCLPSLKYFHLLLPIVWITVLSLVLTGELNCYLHNSDKSTWKISLIALKHVQAPLKMLIWNTSYKL